MDSDLQGKGVQSVERALAILEAVGRVGEMGVTEIAEAVGLHVATSHNLIRTLAARHYLLNAGGRYRLGPASALLAARWNPLVALPGEIQPCLERISQTTGEAASATVLVGASANLIAFRPGTQPITIQYPQWVWPRASELATGRLLMAYAPEKTWDRLIALNAEVEPQWSAEVWCAELRRLREQGHCIRRHAHHGGQTAIAFPIRVAGGEVIAAIGASIPNFRVTSDLCRDVLRCVQAEASDLSRDFGYSAADPARVDVDWPSLLADHEGGHV